MVWKRVVEVEDRKMDYMVFNFCGKTNVKQKQFNEPNYEIIRRQGNTCGWFWRRPESQCGSSGYRDGYSVQNY